jgi:hypothetical protein
MNGSLIALMTTFLLRKAFLKTYQKKNQHTRTNRKDKALGKYNAADTTKAVDSDVDAHVLGVVKVD